MVSYDYYRVFCCAARLGSFTRAAEELMTSQSSISHTVAALERQLGCRLFLRTGRGIALTAEGRRLYDRAAAGCEQLERAEAELRRTVDLHSGLVRLAATETAMRGFLIPALGRFHRRYPELKFRISNGSTAQAVETLRGGGADLAVVPTPLQLCRPMTQRPLARFQDVWIAAAAPFAALRNRTLHLRELLDYPLICLGRGTTTRDFIEELFRRQGLRLSADLEPASSDLVLPLVREGLGIGFVPESLARDAIAAGEVFVLSLQEPAMQRQICLVTSEERTLSLAAQAFADFLLERT